jgi:putative hydrolase of the HAD superfamily
MAIRLLLLDADGVVQRAGTSSYAVLATLVAAEDRDCFLAEVFAAEAPCLTGRADFIEALRPVVERWRLARSAAELAALWRDIVVDASVLEEVRKLRARGTDCALATNQQHYRAHHMVDVLGLQRHFDALYFSCELGFAKPHPMFFETVLLRHGVPAQHALFIDDREENVRAARACGLAAEHFPEHGGVAALRPLLAKNGLET